MARQPSTGSRRKPAARSGRAAAAGPGSGADGFSQVIGEHRRTLELDAKNARARIAQTEREIKTLDTTRDKKSTELKSLHAELAAIEGAINSLASVTTAPRRGGRTAAAVVAAGAPRPARRRRWETQAVASAERRTDQRNRPGRGSGLDRPRQHRQAAGPDARARTPGDGRAGRIRPGRVPPPGDAAQALLPSEEVIRPVTRATPQQDCPVLPRTGEAIVRKRS